MSSWGFGDTGPTEQSLDVRFALMGAHVGGRDDAAFASMSLSLEDLYSWSNAEALQGQIKFDEDSLQPSGHAHMDLHPVDDEVADIEGARIHLTYHLILPTFDRSRLGVMGRMEQRPVLRIVPSEKRSLLDLLRYADAMQDLLALATGRAPNILWLTVSLPRPDTSTEVSPSNRDVSIDVYMSRRSGGSPRAEAVPHREMLFTLADVAFESLVPLWWNARQRFQGACNILIGERFMPDNYVEPQLITAVTAAESFHGALDEKPELSRKEALDRLAPAFGVLSEEDAHWLRSFVPNGFSLRQRLERLVERMPASCSDRLVPDPSAWSRDVKNVRNDLAHRGNTSMDAERMFGVLCVTKAVVVVNLLLELGVDEPRILDSLDGNRELSRASRYGQKYFPR